MSIDYNKWFKAIKKGNVLEIKKYMTEGYDVNMSDDSNEVRDSGLMIACYYDHYPIVELLLTSPDIDVNQLNSDAMIALHFACVYSSLNTVKLLVDHKAWTVFPSKEGFYPIHFASGRDDLDIVKYLVEYVKVDVNVVGHEGKTPLMFAIERKRTKVIEYLINIPQVGINSLYMACGKGYIKLAQKLIALKVDINGLNRAGLTPLYAACKYSNNKELIYFLLLSGADPNQELKAKDGKSVLNLASQPIRNLLQDWNSTIEGEI